MTLNLAELGTAAVIANLFFMTTMLGTLLFPFIKVNYGRKVSPNTINKFDFMLISPITNC